MRRYGVREIQAYDPVFCPELIPQWSDHRPMIGFLGGTPVSVADVGNGDPALQRWISDGHPPIYFGFGSMPVPDPEALVVSIDKVCAALGERALVSAGWNHFDGAGNDRVRIVGPVDHSAVLPQCRAVVHHGGAGTTSAALRAGKPSLVCWVGSDQPFWGSQLERLGAGASMRLSGMDASSLERHLRTVLDPECARRAEVLARRLITPESAVGQAADLIESAVVSCSSTTVPAR
jgi:UDP:flavonoid glycosyltransferase YjiC (YdhE family)